ncbi:MAG: HEAT repeat domain-containing protein [Elusimicrobia bacterium]|nr:HEAT repeat domain-containing protein [Elusimicrobiota bacterium]
MRSHPAASLFLLALCAAPALARVREKTLLRDFDQGTADDRVRLAPALGRLGGKKAVESLLLALDVKHDSPRTTTAIVAALGRAGDPRAVDELTRTWDYLNSMTLQLGELPAGLQVLRVETADALSRCGGKPAVAILETALGDKDPRVVEAAVRGLGRLQDQNAVPALRRLVGASDDLTQAVFESLGRIGDGRCVATLEQGLKMPSKFANIEAAYGLALAGPRKRRKESVRRLEGWLKEDPGEEKAAVLAAYYLAKLDETPGLDHLVKLMNKADSPYAALAAESLGKSGDERAVLPLTIAAKSPDGSVRLAIARALGRLGGTRAVAALRRLRDDPNPGVRAAAAGSLTALGELD